MVERKWNSTREAGIWGKSGQRGEGEMNVGKQAGRRRGDGKEDGTGKGEVKGGEWTGRKGRKAAALNRKSERQKLRLMPSQYRPTLVLNSPPLAAEPIGPGGPPTFWLLWAVGRPYLGPAHYFG